MNNRERIDTLARQRDLKSEDWTALLATFTEADQAYAAELARAQAQRRFGKRIFFRGIIEFTNICQNNCLYCGIRRDNRRLARYRLTQREILSCCQEGYELGYRTFVLQGGEDGFFTDARMAQIIAAIRARYPDCAITLSIGERSEASYRCLYQAGADRYLLRHETADPAHYRLLHPPELSWQRRMDCLEALKRIGYQTGCGFMVGAPGQTPEHLAREMQFLAAFQPQMVGIGPFIPHQDTPFRDEPAGSAETTLFLLSLCRLLLPDVLLPATTALGTVRGDGRQRGVLSGANVIMPNLSPLAVREKYMLYDHKAGTGVDAREGLDLLARQMAEIGYTLASGRGDYRQTEETAP